MSPRSKGRVRIHKKNPKKAKRGRYLCNIITGWKKSTVVGGRDKNQDDEDGGFACHNVLAKKWSENQLCRESEQLKYQLCII